MFAPEEFYDLAMSLAGAHPTEAAFRTGINRCYCACSLAGREATAAKGWFNPRYSEEGHPGLRNALKPHNPWLAW